MNRFAQRLGTALILAASFASFGFPRPAFAEGTKGIDGKVTVALKYLYAKTPVAKPLATSAKGILVFPDIVKGGFIVGGQSGDGALRVNGKTVGYYRSVAASYRLQAGAQKFGYALFFMTDSALEYLVHSDGWELGVGPSIVVLDQGAAASFSTSNSQSDIYAFFFDQKGLMTGIGIQGSKITKINPRK